MRILQVLSKAKQIINDETISINLEMSLWEFSSFKKRIHIDYRIFIYKDSENLAKFFNGESWDKSLNKLNEFINQRHANKH
jgi:hypothetical protein